MYNNLYPERFFIMQSKIGDVVNGWEITDIYIKNIGSQNIQIAKIKSVIGEDRIRECRLTLLTNSKIGWADNRNYSIRNSQKSHGLSKHKLYNVHKAMISRCYDKNSISYKNYGDKGIGVCREWFSNFQSYYDWCINNGWKQGLVVDRIDGNKDYSPDNCRIVTHYENNKNKAITILITAWNETKTANEWSLDSRCQTSYQSLVYRIRQKWNPEEAITTPNKQKCYDNFKQYKSFYLYVKENHPEILEEYKNEC